MAVYNEILVARYNRLLQKLTAIKGGPPAAPLGAEIMPVLPLEDFGAENRSIAGWDRFGLNTQAAAGVGLLAKVQIRNPADSVTVAVIEKLAFLLIGATQDFPTVLIATTNVDLVTVISTNGARFDPRGRRGSKLVVSIATTAGGLGGFIIWNGTGSGANGSGIVEVITTRNQEIPLLPGDSLALVGSVANTPLTPSFFWRERFLEDSERS